MKNNRRLMIHNGWAMNNDWRLMIDDGWPVNYERRAMYYYVWPVVNFWRWMINNWWSIDNDIFLFLVFCTVLGVIGVPFNFLFPNSIKRCTIL